MCTELTPRTSSPAATGWMAIGSCLSAYALRIMSNGISGMPLLAISGL
jgi:hypothetical protein